MLGRRAMVFGACTLCGCSGALHRLPGVGAGQLGLASNEIATGAPPARREVSDGEVLATLRSAQSRLLAPAAGVCREIGAGTCEWRFRAAADRSMNASAMGDGLIVVNRGIVEYARSEDEVAFVLAHEMAHHAADHVRQAGRNTTVGAVLGGLLLGGLAAAAGASSVAGDAAQAGMRAGAGIGRVSFSKEQEREADYIAAVVLHRAGYDLRKARGFLVTMARASNRREAGMLDTHPAGPERLAAYDRAAIEVLASGGRLPARA
jgi:predicted Zn-dependent protease